MNYEERNKKIVQMREEGYTYSEIAKRFKLSTERVRHIYLQNQKIEKIYSSGIGVLFKERSAQNNRIIMRLRRSGITDVDELSKALKGHNLEKIRDIGRKSIYVIEEALIDNGVK